MYEYQAVITRVVDGDTVHATVDLGCDVRINLTLRLAGVNAPELPTAEGVAARDWLVASLAPTTGAVTIRTEKDRREKYGRYLAWLYLGAPDVAGASLNGLLVLAGLAKWYP